VIAQSRPRYGIWTSHFGFIQLATETTPIHTAARHRSDSSSGMPGWFGTAIRRIEIALRTYLARYV